MQLVFAVSPTATVDGSTESRNLPAIVDIVNLVDLNRWQQIAFRVARVNRLFVANWSREMRNRAYVPTVDFEVGLRERGEWTALEDETGTYYATPRIILPVPDRGQRQIESAGSVRLRWDLGEAVHPVGRRQLLREQQRLLDMRELVQRRLLEAWEQWVAAYAQYRAGILDQQAMALLQMSLRAAELDEMTNGEFGHTIRELIPQLTKH